MIPVHEAGEADGVAYIAMRFVAGSDLRSLVRGGGPLDPAEAAGYVAQAGAALDAIHAAGFVHRDVKPANLLIDAGGHVYLTDFGLAKQVLTRSDATATGQWVGTLDYVAPEQIRGAKVDARADVYALGGVLHFALTGRVPFERDGDEAKLWAQLSAPAARALGAAAGPAGGVRRRGRPRDGQAAGGALPVGRRPRARRPRRGRRDDVHRAGGSVARGAAAPVEFSTRTAAATARPRRRAWIVGAVAAGAGGRGRDRRARHPGRRAAATGAGDADRHRPPPFTTRTTERIGDRPNAIALRRRRAVGRRARTRTGSRWSRPRAGRSSPTTSRSAPTSARWSPTATACGSRAAARRKWSAVDARTRRIVAELPVPGTPTSLAVAGSGLWVARQRRRRPGDAAALRPRLRLRQSIAVREGIGGIVAAAGAIWVVKAATNKLARATAGADHLTDWATLPGEVGSIGYGDGALWLTLPAEDAVAKVEARTGRSVVGSAGRAPARAVIAGGRVFVASRNDHTVVVLEPEALRAVGEPIEVGLNPYAHGHRRPLGLGDRAGRQQPHANRSALSSSSACAASATRLAFCGRPVSSKRTNSVDSVFLTVSTDRTSSSAIARLEAGAPCGASSSGRLSATRTRSLRGRERDRGRARAARRRGGRRAVGGAQHDRRAADRDHVSGHEPAPAAHVLAVDERPVVRQAVVAEHPLGTEPHQLRVQARDQVVPRQRDVAAWHGARS